MSFKFKPENFPFRDEKLAQLAAVQANLLLQAHLATLPMLYGRSDGEELYWSKENRGGRTHTALLWGVTELEKKECKHIARIYTTVGGSFDMNNVDCMNCGVKLKHEWKKV